MKLQINKISLVGAERTYNFDPGLNIICGSITTGKSTLVRCLRGLLGSDLKNFPREVSTVVSNLAGQIVLGQDIYEVVRPFVSTPNARVDIAGEEDVIRLPAMRSSATEPLTYGRWLMGELNLPQVDVPTAPSQADSDVEPLSINDYLMYCHLRQDEIDNSVFGHTNSFKNNKRKFVFEVIYGKYGVDTALLYEARRKLSSKLSSFRNQANIFQDLLDGTAFENRALLEYRVEEINQEITNIEINAQEISEAVVRQSRTQKMNEQFRHIESEIEELNKSLQFENSSIEQKERLVSQLKTQSRRLTKSIVAGDFLLDFDFVACPRCGSAVSPSRTDEESCYLCLQHPKLQQLDRISIIKEQDRLEKQIIETRDLISIHQASAEDIRNSLSHLQVRRREILDEINYRTETYISSRVEQLTEVERQRTQLQEEKKRLEDYLELYTRKDNILTNISHLEDELNSINAEIDAANSGASKFEEHVVFLEECFQEALEEIKAPRFPNPGKTGIDRKTYLPVFDGRRFDELQSPGLQVMVNTAHVIAHQLTCLNFNLSLPNFLLIDGLTGNIGYEGLDGERIRAMYSYLIAISEKYKGTLQVIVADNSVPENAREFIKYEFSETDKLIPDHLL